MFILLSILLLNILEFLSCMTEDNNSGGDLLSKLMKFFVSLLDLFVKSLVFDLQLLEID